MRHTKEPWHIRLMDESIGWIDCSNDYSVALTAQRAGDRLHTERIANTRRIVACVNACSDIETPTIEGVSFKKLWSDHKEVLAQRDKLVKLAKQICDYGLSFRCMDELESIIKDIEK